MDRMGEMRFEDQNDEFARPRERATGLDLTQALVKRGMAADRQQSEYILIGIAIVAVAIGAAVWFFSGSSTSIPADRVNAAMQGIRMPSNPR